MDRIHRLLMDRSKTGYVLLWLVPIIFVCSAVLASMPPRLEWSQPRIEITVPAGSTTQTQVELTSTGDMQDLLIEAVPALSGFVTVNPEHLINLEGGQPKTINLSFHVPDDAKKGTYGGTIHVRQGAQTVPATLKIKITVIPVELPVQGYENLSPGTITVDGVSETAFNATNSAIKFLIDGETFSVDPEDVKLFRNNLPVAASAIHVSNNEVQLDPVMNEGRNDFILYALDSQKRLLYYEYTFWAGSRTLQGSIHDENNQPANEVSITVLLGDDQEVMSTTTSVNGQFSFQNIPARTVILEALASDNRHASVAANGADGYVSMRLLAFYDPSPIDNNDFSLGTQGWEIGSAPVQIIPHVEVLTFSSLSAKTTGTPQARTLPSKPLNIEALSASTAAVTQQDEDWDLLLSTSGEGPQTISRSFEVKPGTRNVTVRYRFITTEVPGGYFGTQYNDYFNVSIRSKQGGGLVSDSQSMNGLGLAAFDANGATDWREDSLTVSEEGDTIQVDLTVANVADGYLDSYLIIDIVDEKALEITELTLNDIDNSSLNYLSTDAHTYFGGNTRVNGTVTVEGAEDDSLTSLELEVIQGGGVVARANLAAGAQNTLIQQFGEDEKVEITNSQLLFELLSAQAANVNGANNGTLSLRVRAKSENDEEVTEDVNPVGLLVRYTGGNRYGGRDEGVGGDDWAKPSLRDIANHYGGMLWGDFSNMNGGPFPPHGSHQSGNDVDGWFNGYNQRDANTAAQIIGHLNDATYGSRVVMVFVAFERVDTNTFWVAIRDVVLNDGRRARDVILPDAGHTTHFHWRTAG